MDKQHSIREALVFLDSVRGLYPGGVPKAPAAIRAEAQPKRSVLLHFFGVLEQSQRATLEAACTQGLKISLDAAEFSSLPGRTLKASELSSFIDQKLNEVPSKIAVFMGAEFQSLVEKLPKDQAGFHLWQGTAVMVTENLTTVISDAATKRRFWAALKRTIPLLAA